MILSIHKGCIYMGYDLDKACPEQGVWHWNFTEHSDRPGKAVLVTCIMAPLPTISGGAQYVANALFPLAEEYELHLLIVGYKYMKDQVESFRTRYGELFRSVTVVARDSLPATAEEEEEEAYYGERLEHGLPFLDISYYSARVVDAAAALITRFSIGLLELHSTHVAYLKHFFPDIPALLVSHNIESELFPFWIPATSKLPLERMEQIAEQSRKNAREVEIDNRWHFEAMTFISPSDMHKVTPRVERHHLPLGFPVTDKAYQVRSGACNVLWLGAFDWSPNAEGMNWFAEKVFPLLRDRLEESQLVFHIVGAKPSQQVLALHDGIHVIVHGFVENLDAIFAEADMLMAPLLRGGGVRVKVIQAMSQGLPVIGTTVGCSGIGLTHGKNVWIADTPEAFADGLVELSRSGELRTKIAEEGKIFLLRHHNIKYSLAMKRDIYNRLLAGSIFDPTKDTMRSPYDGLTYLRPIPCVTLDKDYQIADETRFSVIIPFRNEAEGLSEFMQDLAAQTARPAEILMIDHDSTDSSCQIATNLAKKYQLPIRLLHAEEGPQARSGRKTTVAGNRNYAIQEAQTDLLLFTDAGTRLHPCFFANMIGPMQEDPSLEMTGGIYYAQSAQLTATLVYDWDTVDWNSFLPACRALAMRKALAIRAGGLPEFLTFAGEDALFDITFRRLCNKWAFNRRAIVYWNAPDTVESLRKKFYTYGIGDGESGIGDFLFSRNALHLQRTGTLPPELTILDYNYAAFQGYFAGRARRGTIDRTLRGVRNIVLLPVEKPLFAAKSTRRLIGRLVGENTRVLCIIADAESTNQGKLCFMDFDFTLCELHYMKDFRIEDFLARYGNPELPQQIAVMRDPDNTSERVVAFIASLRPFSLGGDE